MTFRVIVQPRAEREIRETAFWIREQAKSPTPALRWARGIRAKIETLKEFPHRCPVDPDSAVYGEEVRVLLFGRRPRVYRILFAIRGNVVHVLTVRHSARRSLRDAQEEIGEEE
jgi:plasmid stabilization system protein ParE